MGSVNIGIGIDELFEVNLMTLDIGQVYIWAATGMLLGFTVARMVRGWGFRTTTNAALGLVSGVAGGAGAWFLSRYIPDLELMRFSFSAVDVIAAALSAAIVLMVIQFVRQAR
jgi:uncharacterized membrane protein YeaQ/YmgE (transglycosylase-associated protein family)